MSQNTHPTAPTLDTPLPGPRRSFCWIVPHSFMHTHPCLLEVSSARQATSSEKPSQFQAEILSSFSGTPIALDLFTLVGTGNDIICQIFA